MDTLTNRIETVIRRQGKFKCTVMQLAGIDGRIWYRRSRTGDWRTGEVREIARVLRVPFDRLVGGA